MVKKQILKMVRKLNMDNPLEFVREAVAPLCKEKLNEHILNCNDCKTCTNYEKKIATGNPNANFLIINDNATDNEDIIQYFYDMLDVAGISRNDIFVINSISCVLKKAFNDETIIRLPNRNEANNCKYFVKYAIDFVKPRIIICMGATSLAIFKNDVTIEDIKGQFIDINGFKAIVTHSAKDVFTMAEFYTEDEINEYANNIVEDLIKAKEYVDSLRR